MHAAWTVRENIRRIYLESGEKRKQRESKKEENERIAEKRQKGKESRPMAGNTFRSRQRCVCVMWANSQQKVEWRKIKVYCTPPSAPLLDFFCRIPTAPLCGTPLFFDSSNDFLTCRRAQFMAWQCVLLAKGDGNGTVAPPQRGRTIRQHPADGHWRILF